MAVTTARDLDVVIVGGSIAGLCVGVALKRLPSIRSLTILERYRPEQLRDQGAGIRVTTEVAEFFQGYANATMDDYGTSLDHATMLDVKGEVLVHRELVGNCATTWVQLVRVLTGAFLNKGSNIDSANCDYRYSFNVLDLVEREEKIELRFATDVGQEGVLLADLVVGADGASSKVRGIVLPEVKRTYAGYVILRGLVPVEDLSDRAKSVMGRSGTSCFTQNSQIVSYAVPANETGRPDERNLLNWGWYQDKTDEELRDLMTDFSGRRHPFTLPQGAMQEQFADEIRATAKNELPGLFVEMVEKTRAPFVQVITDSDASQNMFYGGKVFLVGDSAAGQRPHTGSAVTQACFHAHLLRLHLQGTISANTWRQETRVVSSTLVKSGQEIGSICMSRTLEPGEKIKLFVGKQVACSKLLADKWAEFTVADGTKLGY